MKIRTQFIISGVIFGVIAFMISASVIITNQQVQEVHAQQTLATEVEREAYELGYLSNDYLLYRESQQASRWESKFASFSNHLSNLNVATPEQRMLVSNIKANHQRLRAVFLELRATIESQPQLENAVADPRFMQVSWNRLEVQNQGMIFDTLRLGRLLAEQEDALRLLDALFSFGLVGLFGAFLFFNYALTIRSALKGLAELAAGTKIIGSGNLDFAFVVKREDEIGELSRAFNRMTANLKQVTASKAELEQEIVERKRAEEELHKSEQRWATTLASIGDAVIATDVAGKITYMNAVAEELTGWTLGEAEIKSLKDVFKIINEYTRQEAADPVSVVLETGMIVGLANHTILARKDGTEIAIDDSAAPIKNREGKTTGVVLIFRDITERRRAEEQMRLQAAALQAAANAIVIAKLDGSIQWINPAFTHLTGYSAAEAIGQNPRLLKSGKHDSAFYKAMWNTMQTGKVWRGEVINKYKDGSLHTEDMTITPVPDTGGAITHFIAIKQDITERKRAEERLAFQAHILANITDVVYATDEQLRLTAWNHAAEKTYGWTEAEVLGKNVAEVVKSKFDPELRAKLTQELLASGSVTAEIEHQTRSGVAVFFESVTILLRDPEGKATGLVSVNRDITARKHAEQELAWRASFPERNPYPIVEVDLIGHVYYRNPAARRILPDLVARGSDHPWLADWQTAIRTLCANPASPLAREVVFDGRDYQQTMHYLADIGRVRIYGLDITERKKRETELAKLTRTLRALSNSNQVLMHSTDEAEFLNQVSKIVVEDCGYVMVWIGYAEPDADKTVRPAAHAGFEDGYLETLKLTWADTERGHGPTGAAIRTGKPSVCKNMLTDPNFAPWRAEALKRGYQSTLVLPLMTDDKVFGVISIYSKECDPFSADEVSLLSELAGDLAYGVTALRLRAAHARAEKALRESEERYRSLFNSMTEGFALHEIICDEQCLPKDYWFIEVNPAFEKLTGLKRQDVVGKPVSEVLPKNDPYWVQIYGKVALTGEPIHFENYSSALDQYYEVYAYAPAPLQFATVLVNITERKRAEQEIRRLNEDLRQRKEELEIRVAERTKELELANNRLHSLAQQIVSVQEEERQRLSRELHDEAGQSLTALKVSLAMVKQRIPVELSPYYEQIDGALSLLNETIDQIRMMAHDLRPPALDAVGLGIALEDYCNDFARRTGLAIEYADVPLPELPSSISICFYRCVQEALTNAYKHADAGHIMVCLEKDAQGMCLSVEDDGRGFDVNAYRTNRLKSAGIGLLGMRERLDMFGGDLIIESEIGKGTRLIARVPWKEMLGLAK